MMGRQLLSGQVEHGKGIQTMDIWGCYLNVLKKFRPKDEIFFTEQLLAKVGQQVCNG
jgi:hypothetical protein